MSNPLHHISQMSRKMSRSVSRDILVGTFLKKMSRPSPCPDENVPADCPACPDKPQVVLTANDDRSAA